MHKHTQEFTEISRLNNPEKNEVILEIISESEKDEITALFNKIFLNQEIFENILLPHLSYKDHLKIMRQTCKSLNDIIEETDIGKWIRNFSKRNEPSFFQSMYQNNSYAIGVITTVLVSVIPPIVEALVPLTGNILNALILPGTLFLLLILGTFGFMCVDDENIENYTFSGLLVMQALICSAIAMSSILINAEKLKSEKNLGLIVSNSIAIIINLLGAFYFGNKITNSINSHGASSRMETEKEQRIALDWYVKSHPSLMFSRNELQMVNEDISLHPQEFANCKN